MTIVIPTGPTIRPYTPPPKTILGYDSRLASSFTRVPVPTGAERPQYRPVLPKDPPGHTFSGSLTMQPAASTLFTSLPLRGTFILKNIWIANITLAAFNVGFGLAIGRYPVNSFATWLPLTRLIPDQTPVAAETDLITCYSFYPINFPCNQTLVMLSERLILLAYAPAGVAPGTRLAFAITIEEPQ